MPACRKVSGTVGFLSSMSAWSLLVFGALSLLLVCFSWTWAGGFIAIALLTHGGLEMWLKNRFVVDGNRSTGKKLAWNQLALAGSVLLYLSWQAGSFDRAELDAMFARDPMRSLLQLTPPEVVEMLNRDFPKFLAVAYGAAGFVVLLGCLGMALMYLKARSKT